MGRLRAPYLSREWGGKLYGYMKELKAIFDPQGILNSKAMFSEQSITDDMRRDYLAA
jgi:D-lactate dehydrogenase